MSRNASFTRKVIYIAAIALLLLPLSALSQPATISREGLTRGGTLAQMRTEYNLAQAELGEIDPASETMKLATLGLRGVAANILWGQANHYKKVEDWDKLEATVQQIIRLQPNFLEVWDFQAHNLSYNVSAEFDDYRFRYEWVKKGIDFLILGTQYNRDEPGLLYSLGWYVGQKLGRADEAKQFRRMFRDDRDFHAVFRKNGVEVDQPDAIGPDGKPDNWLAARLWYLKGVDSVVYSGKPIRGRSPLLFYDGAPKSLMNAGDAMQKDGFFRQRTQAVWEKALQEWNSYGNRDIPTSAGFNIRLNELESIKQRMNAAEAEIDKLAPGIREEIHKEKIAALSDDERAALRTPEAERTGIDFQLAMAAEPKTRVSHEEIIDRADREARPQLRALAEQIETDQQLARFTESYRGIVNYIYWRTRCEAERMDITQGAHADLFRADQLKAAGEHFTEAKQLYEKAFAAWAQVFDEHPELINNAEAKDLVEAVERYNDLLGQLEADFPADFPLTNFLEKHEDGQKLLQRVRLLGDSPATPPPAAEDKPAPDNAGDKKADEKPADDKPADKEPAEKKAEKSEDSKSDESKADDAKSSGKAEPAEKSATKDADEPVDKPADSDDDKK